MKLKELGTIVTGNTPSKQSVENWDSPDIGFVKPDIISDTGISIIDDAAEYISEKARAKARIVGENSILITCIGSIGKIGITAKGTFAFNQQINAIIPNRKVNSKYLAYALLYAKPRLVAIANAPVVPIINKSQFGDFEIKVTENTEYQSKAVEVLDTVNAIIESRRQQLQKLDELVKARFVELFGDLKSNPMEWPVVPFTEFAKIDGNMTTDYEKYADYPHIGIDSIEKGTGALKGYRTVREDGVISGKYIFTSQHIIYSKIRPNLNKVALPDFEGLCSADAYPILPNHSNCNRVFLAIALRSKYFLEYILQFSSRTNLPKVNRKEITGFRMPLPPLKLQEQFAAFVEQTDKSKVAVQKSLDEAQHLFDCLMQEYFS